MSNKFPKERCVTTSIQGQAGVYRVASELMLRGFHIALPVVDTGVDIVVLEGGIRVQVKSSHIVRSKQYEGQNMYAFFLARGPRPQGGGISIKSKPKEFSNECDFVVLWGIEENRFWIVPASKLDGRWNVVMGRKSKWLETDSRQIYDMRESGMTGREIAAKLGLSEMTVSRRIKGLYAVPPDQQAKLIEINLCEGRWDLIESYIGTMQEVESITSTAEAVSECVGQGAYNASKLSD